jgi:hypothetical protein
MDKRDKDALNLINRQKAEIDNLEYTLLGVMHFVDKWLDGDELEQDEVKRSEIMREKTLKIVEEQQTEIERLKKGFKKLVEKQNLYKENMQATREYQIEQAKSESIKEFAERVKSEYEGFNEEHEIIEYPNLLKAIDCVAKEMVGDE